MSQYTANHTHRLKGCPGCGGEHGAVKMSEWRGKEGQWEVICLDCGKRSPFCDTRECAVTCWNLMLREAA